MKLVNGDEKAIRKDFGSIDRRSIMSFGVWCFSGLDYAISDKIV